MDMSVTSLDCDAADSHYRVQSQYLYKALLAIQYLYKPTELTIDECSEILQISDVLVRRISSAANLFENLFTEPLDDIRSLRKNMDRKG